jgi:hypothetical protein
VAGAAAAAISKTPGNLVVNITARDVSQTMQDVSQTMRISEAPGRLRHQYHCTGFSDYAECESDYAEYLRLQVD